MNRHTFPACHAFGLRAGLATLALGMVTAASPAAAVMYKWVDASGRVSYSDQLPPGNVKWEVVQGAPPVSPEAIRELATQEAELKKRQAQRAEEQKKTEKSRADAAAQQQACVDARGRLQIFSSGQPVTFINEQGEQLFMDELQKSRERVKAETQVRQICNG